MKITAFFRALASLSLLAGASACATPQQQCIAQSRSEITQLSRKAKVARANIERGYAIHTQRRATRTASVCFSPKGEAFPCFKTGHTTVETPVSIDVSHEKRKLTALEKRIAALTPAAQRAAEKCAEIHPE